MIRLRLAALVVLAAACSRQRTGEQLARTYCAACHMFPEPGLLDKRTWRNGVLPAMAPRLGVSTGSLFARERLSPYMQKLPQRVPDGDWQQIVAYYLAQAPDSLPYQTLPAEPQQDPPFFQVTPFVPHLVSSAIVTLLKADSVQHRIYMGEAGTNLLRVFDWQRRLVTQLKLASPPTDVIVEGDRLLLLESGILDPNDEPRGTLEQYRVAPSGALTFEKVLIDSLLRPVFARKLDVMHDGRDDFLICEFGNNRGRLARYRWNGARFERQVLSTTPGAIRFEVRDMTGDGAPDIVALFAQADERIVLYPNDGHGNFSEERVLARFPPVYGSMHFTLADFNGDGFPDILYVNGDNFDYSRILKPYHGVHILENDGHNNFTERYFFPLYGAAQAVVADFAGDGRPDILAVSNFADLRRHPERGIVYLRNLGGYHFQPFDFSLAASDQWNVMTAGDFNGDGRPEVLVGAMSLANVAAGQRQFAGQAAERGKDPVLLFRYRPAGAGGRRTP